MFRAGDTIGPFTLTERLGAGSFGEVWLARRQSTLLVKDVALKFALQETADFERIRREVQMWTKVGDHPNILPILEAEVYGGIAVIVSEYAPGGSLATWLRLFGGKAPTTADAVRMTTGILKGLAHLHGQSPPILHRDLKPANILLRGGEPCIADFGLAQHLGNTLSNVSLTGTVPYMAPEMFRNKRGVQADLWAVGVILHEMLSGHQPFTPPPEPAEEETPPSDFRKKDTVQHDPLMPLPVPPSLYATIHRILTREPDPLPSEIPPPLARFVRKALAKEPTRRFTGAPEMLLALQEAEHEAWALEREMRTRPRAGAKGVPVPADLDAPLDWELIPILPEEAGDGEPGNPVRERPPVYSSVTREDVVPTLRLPTQGFPGAEGGAIAPPPAPAGETLGPATDPPPVTAPVEPPPLEEAVERDTASPPDPEKGRGQPVITLAPPVPPPEVPRGEPKAPSRATAPPRTPRPGQAWTDPLGGLVFVWVPPGTFEMGVKKRWFGSRADFHEWPRHKVEIAGGFWMSRYPATVSDYVTFCRETGTHLPPRLEAHAPRAPHPGTTADRRPVAGVSLPNAAAYCRWLTAKAGGGRYRLPSEAEWEYACRAGAAENAPLRLNDMAWHQGNADGAVHPVGQKVPNAWGLCDILGNVMEWCADTWHPDYRGAPADGRAWTEGVAAAFGVARGGAWSTDPVRVTLFARFCRMADDAFDDVGFRVVREA